MEYGLEHSAESESFALERNVWNCIRQFLMLLSVGALVLILPACFFVLHHSLATTVAENIDAGENAGDVCIHSACYKTRYPDFCISSFTWHDQLQVPKNLNITPDAQWLTITSMKITQHYHSSFLNLTKTLHSEIRQDASARTDTAFKLVALADCVSLVEDGRDLICSSFRKLVKCKNNCSQKSILDVQTWISAAMTDHNTCMNGIEDMGWMDQTLKQRGERVQKLLSISLSFLVSLYNVKLISKHSMNQTTPRLVFPMWVKKSDFQTLEISSHSPLVNVTVAKDGSGEFLTVQDAINDAPLKSGQRFVIYIKNGTYNETILVPRDATNIMLIGDGINETVITGNLNVQDGWTTFNSATAAIEGDGFLAQDITFRNTAGAIKHQAVALRVDSDQSAFYRCSFEGYQDTLYAHSRRQFYRDCIVLGTVDFIFGNAVALFQNCTLLARVPLEHQKLTFTAQGRNDPNQNTGLSFEECTLDGIPELKANIRNFSAYLGRPWRLYSRTVFLKCYEGSLINPEGWLQWNTSLALDHLFYAEYKCEGPGFIADQRVLWSTQITNSSLANQFSVDSFLSGDNWLPATGFPFEDSLNETHFG